MIGTTPYMSPEQASGEHVDFRSDQFALGALLYEAAPASPRSHARRRRRPSRRCCATRRPRSTRSPTRCRRGSSRSSGAASRRTRRIATAPPPISRTTSPSSSAARTAALPCRFRSRARSGSPRRSRSRWCSPRPAGGSVEARRRAVRRAGRRDAQRRGLPRARHAALVRRVRAARVRASPDGGVGVRPGTRATSACCSCAPRRTRSRAAAGQRAGEQPGVLARRRVDRVPREPEAQEDLRGRGRAPCWPRRRTRWRCSWPDANRILYSPMPSVGIWEVSPTAGAESSPSRKWRGRRLASGPFSCERHCSTQPRSTPRQLRRRSITPSTREREPCSSRRQRSQRRRDTL
jgi:serine/threonine protein kinase